MNHPRVAPIAFHHAVARGTRSCRVDPQDTKESRFLIPSVVAAHGHKSTAFQISPPENLYSALRNEKTLKRVASAVIFAGHSNYSHDKNLTKIPQIANSLLPPPGFPTHRYRSLHKHAARHRALRALPRVAPSG